MIAIPYCQNRSAKEAGEALAALNVENNLVVGLGDYRTSAVFYSNQTIYRLEKKANIEAIKPKEMSCGLFGGLVRMNQIKLMRIF